MDPYLYELYLQNRSIGDPGYSFCVAAYSILVFLAISANVLVLSAIWKSRDLRKSARNVLIGVLAVSDLFLAGTMPLTGMYWLYGKIKILLEKCKLLFIGKIFNLKWQPALLVLTNLTVQQGHIVVFYRLLIISPFCEIAAFVNTKRPKLCRLE